MSYRKRTLLLIVVIEILLAGFFLYAVGMPGTPDQIAERGRLIGMIMGVILGLSPLLYLMARNNDRKKAERDRQN
jgi:uncharacterized membrane protein YiaA